MKNKEKMQRSAVSKYENYVETRIRKVTAKHLWLCNAEISELNHFRVNQSKRKQDYDNAPTEVTATPRLAEKNYDSVK